MERNRAPLFIAVLLVLTLLMGGCAGKESTRERIVFYTLEYTAPSPEELESLDCTVRVERFSVAPGYSSRSIVYREKPYVRKEYYYHRWRANPADLVGQFLERDLRECGLFGAVIPADSRFPSSFMLEGSVDKFLEVDTGDGWEALVEVSVALLVEDEPDISRKVLFQKGFRGVQVCKEKNPEALAEAMSGALKEVSAEIIRETHRHLKGLCPERKEGRQRVSQLSTAGAFLDAKNDRF